MNQPDPLLELLTGEELHAFARGNAQLIDTDRLALCRAVRRMGNRIAGMASTLEAIANMKVDDHTNHAQLSALCIATARVGLKEG